jgi:aldose sugar dehydrogenase
MRKTITKALLKLSTAWVVVLALFLCHCQINKANNEKESAAPENYMKYCAGCHGEKLEKFAAKQWMDEEGNLSVFNSIKFGIEDIGMPAFQKTFTDPEIEELADYVKKGIPADRTILTPGIGPGGVVKSEMHNFVLDTVVKG